MDLEHLVYALGVLLIAVGAALAWLPAGPVVLGAGAVVWALLLGPEG
jgi:hypothetical protein